MGKGGDKSAVEEKPQWVKISGKFYDVTNFKHPGGNIIDLFKGMVSRKCDEKLLGWTTLLVFLVTHILCQLTIMLRIGWDNEFRGFPWSQQEGSDLFEGAAAT